MLWGIREERRPGGYIRRRHCRLQAPPQPLQALVGYDLKHGTQRRLLCELIVRREKFF